MEFGVALFGAVAGTALTKLRAVIEERLAADTDATFIVNELTLIEAIFKDSYASSGGHVSCLQTVCIAQLLRLAYDIEDRIDCFDANKTTRREFAQQISELRTRSQFTREQIHGYMGPIAIGITRTATVAAYVPTQLQRLLDDPDPIHQVWLVRNLNCLLYLCLFPRDHHVRTKPLIRRWLAEGLIQREQLAVNNLRKFIKSNIINSMSISNNGNVKRCQPTSEVLEYISHRSMSENFILFCDGTAELEAEDARRLSVHPCANGELILPATLYRLRTLAVFPTAGATSLASYGSVLDFARYKVLRVLDLKECAALSAEHLTDIWKQVLMKYLSINLGSIRKITRQIGYMEQLETLDLSGTEVVTVFKEVLLLPKLKHLFGKFQLSKRDTLFFGWDGWVRTSNMYKFLRKKSVLETLAGFVTGGRPGFPQLMSLMKMLRKVKIWCKSNASQKNLGAISRAITKFIRDGTDEPQRDRSLTIEFVGCSGQFLNTIDPGRLASLKLHGNLSALPPFVAQLSGIEELCLWSSGLNWQDIIVGLANLGILKYLKLIEDNLGSIEIAPDHLNSIERICFVCKTTIDISIQAKALPQLVSLHILCQDLFAIPGTPGIEITHMANLKEIALCPQVTVGVKNKWEHGASGHPNMPVVLFIEDP